MTFFKVKGIQSPYCFAACPNFWCFSCLFYPLPLVRHYTICTLPLEITDHDFKITNVSQNKLHSSLTCTVRSCADLKPHLCCTTYSATVTSALALAISRCTCSVLKFSSVCYLKFCTGILSIISTKITVTHKYENLPTIFANRFKRDIYSRWIRRKWVTDGWGIYNR